MKRLAFDFAKPPGEPALAGPDSVSWQIFKNPIALFVGGITAVLLELAEARVRSGVWGHSSFRTDPLQRMERTGLAAMVTVYGARSAAQEMIERIGRMHARVKGTTPDGRAYDASDPELLNWVHTTAVFGFLQAYAAFVRPLDLAERDRFFAEAAVGARLYGATGAPTSQAQLDAQLAAMRPKLEPSPIVFEFLELLRATRILPRPLGRLQQLLIRAAVEITPGYARETLGLGSDYGLRSLERPLVAALGRVADRVPIPGTPVALASRRLGLPASYVYRRPRDGGANAGHAVR